MLSVFGVNSRTPIQAAIQSGAELVPRFDLHLAADAKTWSMSLIDRTNGCKFTVFTNDTGVIFTGYPIDFLVLPSKPAGN